MAKLPNIHIDEALINEYNLYELSYYDWQEAIKIGSAERYWEETAPKELDFLFSQLKHLPEKTRIIEKEARFALVSNKLKQNLETIKTKIKEERKMSQFTQVTNMVKSDLGEAAYRVGATQLTKMVKAGILKLLGQNGGVKKSVLNTVRDFLDTELGDALVAYLLGLLLSYIPKFKEHPVVQKLSKELRIHGMVIVGETIVNAVMEFLIPAITDVLKTMEEQKVELPSAEENTTDSKSLLEEIANVGSGAIGKATK